MGRLDGRVAIITGAARGIGAATARLFAAEGAAVVCNDVDADPLRETVDAIAAAGGRAHAHPGDCGDDAVAGALVAAAVHEHGALDILVNNAGITADAPFQELGDRWDRVLDAQLRTTVAASRAATRHFRERAIAELAADGRVAWQRKITSTVPAAWFTGNPGQANLTAAGGAVVGLTRTLARELGGFGVNVNAVAPGFVETRLTAAESEDSELGIAEPLRQMTKAMTALGRYGQPEDLARVHLFLASSDADFVTGVTIPVAGGLLGTCV